MAIVILDLETTGLKPVPKDHIWEFSAFRRDPVAGGTWWHYFVQHDLDKAARLPESFRADHDARYDPARAITVRELVDLLDEVFAGRPHVYGAVPSFDTQRLSWLLGYYGRNPEPFHYHTHCVETMTIGWLLGRESMGEFRASAALEHPDDSDELSAAAGIAPPGPGVRHTATGDVLWADRLLDRISNGVIPGEGPRTGVRTEPAVARLLVGQQFESLPSHTECRGLFHRLRVRRRCWHHDPATGESWFVAKLIDLGRRKELRCSHCGKTWFI